MGVVVAMWFWLLHVGAMVRLGKFVVSLTKEGVKPGTHCCDFRNWPLFPWTCLAPRALSAIELMEEGKRICLYIITT